MCSNIFALNEYINLYGKNNWALSTYNSNLRLLDNYVRPTLGDMKLEDLSTRVIEKYYMQMQKTKAVPKVQFGRVIDDDGESLVSNSTIREIHKILRNCFNQALKWELMEKNPCLLATVPKVNRQKREIWTAETLFHALEVCKDERLKMALNLTFACSLRMGELLGFDDHLFIPSAHFSIRFCFITPLNILPSVRCAAPFTLFSNCSRVFPKPLLPDVANRIIFFSVKS